MALNTGYLMLTGGGVPVLSIDPEVEARDRPESSEPDVPEGNDVQVLVTPAWLVQVTGVNPLPQAHRRNPANGTRRSALIEFPPSIHRNPCSGWSASKVREQTVSTHSRFQQPFVRLTNVAIVWRRERDSNPRWL
jgi:hypothetical protein